MIGTFFRRVVTGLLLALVLLLVAVGAFAISALSAGYPNAPRAARPRSVVLGAYHVHSAASDGSGTAEEIADAAYQAGLQFVILTDHNPERLGAPRFAANGVLLIEAAELSTPHGHVVALDTERPLTAAEREGDPIGAIRALNGYAVLAHPVQERNPWKDWARAGGAVGFEVYSGDTMLRQALAAPFTRLLPAAGAYLTNSTHALAVLQQEHPDAIRKLLELSVQAPMVALCAHDAHGLPPYEEMFQQLALTVPLYGLGGREALPARADEAARFILTQIVQGRAFCTFRSHGDGAGFSLEPESPNRRFRAGEVLKVTLPGDAPPSAVRLECHGPCEVQKDGKRILLQGKGPVHLELWRRAPGRFFGAEWKPWIVPSPVLVDD
jgi:hypothetical protein